MNIVLQRGVSVSLFQSVYKTSELYKPTNRNLWGWLNAIFNRVDNDRRKQVGPDRACAEWLLRCGASVKWQNFNHWVKDYNTLPGSNFKNYQIEEIDASDSAVMAVGFPHLEGLKHVKRITLHNCGYLDDSALSYLPCVKDSLIYLQLSSCGDISNQGLQPIQQLKNLKRLKMFDLPEVRNMPAVIDDLQKKLPECTIEYIPEKKKGE
ncbi:ATP synthase subunit s, mitochondrial [Patella vulgata]|uniref:ATP synthase subunit s, mitochondrial n=1 Tax=Patella vulgata TaxID=6465 RepID=UPI0024A956C7|nr:ATP synthase subunit s, mitochondrial [Patella vulgata]